MLIGSSLMKNTLKIEGNPSNATGTSSFWQFTFLQNERFTFRVLIKLLDAPKYGFAANQNIV